MARNVLFILCDQLRADYLSCYGHPVVETPNIDALARRGVRFERAFVQAGVCGASRMSFYTGRYCFSHGATWNFVPMPIGERTLGDYLAPRDLLLALVGKTHFVPNTAEMARFGIDPRSDAGRMLMNGGFEVVTRHEGDLPIPRHYYNEFLKARGYDGDNPWASWANGALGADGAILDGMAMRNAHLPARIPDQHSETAYVTDAAIDYITERGEQPWALHLSYIKPHWPYIVSAPYHAMYRGRDSGPINRSEAEERTLHPAIAANRASLRACQTFGREEVARHVRPAYMGLIRQIDDHLGRLFRVLERLGRFDDTLIVFSSDHGDFLGDHGLGEKEILYDEAMRVPFIVVDPDARADATRGSTEARLVEAVDVVPTVLDALGMDPMQHVVEGRSLVPLLRGERVDWRDCAFAELDYAFLPMRKVLGRGPSGCHATMARTADWKLVDWEGMRPQLFDLRADPREQNDLAAAGSHAKIIAEMRERIAAWRAARKRRTAWDEATADANHYPADKAGVMIGLW